MTPSDDRERPLRWMEWSLVAIGVGMLSLAASQYLEAREVQAELQQTVRAVRASRPPSHEVSAPHARFPWNLRIARLGVSVAVMEGTNPRTLAVAGGHILGTRRPGQPGTTGIAAHRDTFFRPLRGIRVGDRVRVETPDGVFDYVVESTAVVRPDDTSLLRSTGSDALVLVTCFPFTYIGAAPNRFVVRCVPVRPGEGAT